MKLIVTSLVATTALLTASLGAAQDGGSAITLGGLYVTAKSGGPLRADSVLTSVDIMGRRAGRG